MYVVFNGVMALVRMYGRVETFCATVPSGRLNSFPSFKPGSLLGWCSVPVERLLY